MLDLGKDQSNNFNAQVFATTASFLRYNLLNYLNEGKKCGTLGGLFEYLVDESAVVSYADRIWASFQGLFLASFSKIFQLFEINDDPQAYISVLTEISADCFSFNERCET